MTREDEIFEKLKNGDKSGAGELAELYYADIFRYCLFHVPDRQTAEDAVQETFLKVFRHFEDYRHQGKFRAFLYKVAANVCIDLCRKKRWGPVPESVPYEEPGIREGEDREELRLFAFLCSLSFDVYLKKMMIEKLIDELASKE